VSASKLRALLEEESGIQDFHFVVPHPFLPPRYREMANNRNMILVLDECMTVRIRWEGSRFEEYSPLNPAAAGHLLKEVRANMTKYRTEVRVFEDFIRKYAEKPLDLDRPLDPWYRDRDRTLEAKRVQSSEGTDEVEVEVVADLGPPIKSFSFQGVSEEQGGESPMGDPDLEFVREALEAQQFDE
jgi:hypothetical protein